MCLCPRPWQPVGTNKLTSEWTCILEDFKASQAFDSSAVIPGNTQGSLPCVAFLPLGLLPYHFLFRIYVSARHLREAPLEGHGCVLHPQTFHARGGAVSQASLQTNSLSAPLHSLPLPFSFLEKLRKCLSSNALLPCHLALKQDSLQHSEFHRQLPILRPCVVSLSSRRRSSPWNQAGRNLTSHLSPLSCPLLPSEMSTQKPPTPQILHRALQGGSCQPSLSRDPQLPEEAESDSSLRFSKNSHVLLYIFRKKVKKEKARDRIKQGRRIREETWGRKMTTLCSVIF